MITTNTKQEQGVSILEIFLQTSDMPWTIYVNTKLEQGVSIPGIFLKTSDMPWAIKLPCLLFSKYCSIRKGKSNFNTREGRLKCFLFCS